jgi:hypothetical protein
MSRQCACRWVRRWRSDGEIGLADQSRPHHSPTRTPPGVEQASWPTGSSTAPAVRRPRLGIRSVRGRYRESCPGPSSAAPAGGAGPDHRGRWRVSVPRGPARCAPSATGPATGPYGRQEDRPDPRRWRLPPHGRAATSEHKHKKVLVGFDYVHALIDDHSRLAYSEMLANEKGTTCAAVLDRALGLPLARLSPTHDRGHLGRSRLSPTVGRVARSIAAMHASIQVVTSCSDSSRGVVTWWCGM